MFSCSACPSARAQGLRFCPSCSSDLAVKRGYGVRHRRIITLLRLFCAVNYVQLVVTLGFGLKFFAETADKAQGFLVFGITLLFALGAVAVIVWHLSLIVMARHIASEFRLKLVEMESSA